MNISNMHDLRIAKMQCRYEIELQERTMQNWLHDLKSATQESLKKSLRHFAKEFAFNLAKNLVLYGKRKN
jgi:hypothetical protein